MADGSVADDDVTRFSVADYVVVVAMLAVSLGIGFYQACSGGHQRTTEEFLMANRKMNPVPVAMSLVASFISAITFLGTPTEIYLHGFTYIWYCLATSLSCIVGMVLFLPVFYRLGLTSANEYLELRFNRATRLLGSVMFSFYMIIYLGIVLYAPSLALNAVTGLHLWGSVFAIGIVCTTYTTIGGMKAVLWTDTFQMTLMVIGFIAIIIRGAIEVGGMKNVWEIASNGKRLDVWVWTTDVTIRHTIWGIVIGGTFAWTSTYGVNQAQVQRYLTCTTLRTAKISLGLASIGMVFIIALPSLVGLTMYANYADCDPASHGLVTSTDQMMPYFIMDLFSSLPGLPGLLTSAVFSAALSTVSSGLNALSAVVGEDFIKARWPSLEERTYTWIDKGIALSFGVLAMFMALIVSTLGEILQTSMNVFGIFSGPILGLYSCGFFFPWNNSKGAISGTCMGLLYAFWLGIGTQLYPNPPDDPPLSVDGCLVSNATGYPFDVTMRNTIATTALYGNMTTSMVDERPAIANFYKMSYAWWGVTSWLVTVIVASLVSLLTGPQNPKKLDPRLICPIVDNMYCCLPEKWKKPLRCGVGEEYVGEERIEYQAVALDKEKFADEKIKKETIAMYPGPNSATQV